MIVIIRQTINSFQNTVTSEDEIEAFLEQQGIKTVTHEDVEEVNQPLEIKGPTGTISPKFKLVKLSPSKMVKIKDKEIDRVLNESEPLKKVNEEHLRKKLKMSIAKLE